MTYCVAIKVNTGLVFASDSRTNAGVDHISTYSKMFTFDVPGERLFVLLSAGNLATTQAVLNLVQRDLDDPDAEVSLNNVEYLFNAAHYIGELSQYVQNQHSEALKASGSNPSASFIIGGQIKGGLHDIYLVYPEGNYITSSSETPYLQIGETKYGKPILDRVITSSTTLEDAGRCAIVSLDSTMRSNISVGPPVELAFYHKDQFELAHRLTLKLASPLYASMQKRWNEGIRRAFTKLPKFDWENTK